MILEPDKFPIDGQLEQIYHSLQENNCLLIKAETGAGKTTRLPPYLTGKVPGKILVLEPRRLAAKLSAQRCSELLDSKIGDQVGHHIRFDKKVGQDTLLLFITEGLFLPYLREDQTLSEYNTIILDEFHERSIHTDIALCLIRKLQQTTRPDLKLIIMSATLDTLELEKYLASDEQKVDLFNVAGRVFPIEIEYHENEVKDAVLDMLKDSRCPQNILVFLPGMGPIRTLENELKSSIPKDIEVVPLHSSLSKEAQDKAFKGQKRKVILSTNIAETSLTIPHITGVIDTGTERRASFAPWSGMPLLQLEKISKASATQRAGRAGRVQEGLVYRMYSLNEFGQRENFTPPEIKRVELSHYLLDLLDLELKPDLLNWFEMPEEKNLIKSMELLKTIGAVKNDIITDKGKYLAKLPLHPRLGAMIYQAFVMGSDIKEQKEVLLAVCLLNEGPLYSKQTKFSNNPDIDEPEACDLCVQMDLIKSYKYKDKELSDYHHSMLDQRAYKRVIELYISLSDKLKIESQLLEEKSLPDLLLPSLLSGYPDRVAGKRKVMKKGRAQESYNFCMGRGGLLSQRTALNSASPDFIIVHDALENPKANAAIGTSITSASKITAKQLLDLNPQWIEEVKESQLNEKNGTLSLKKIQKYGNLTLHSETLPPLIPQGEVLAQLMIENWPWPFDHDEELIKYNARVDLLNQAKLDHQCPEFKDDMFELLIQSSIEDETSYQDIQNLGLKELIYSQLAPQDLYLIDVNTPKEVMLNNGKKFKIHYGSEENNGEPYIEARIQDLYGTTEHPTIAEEKIPLLIKLMSPAHKAIQLSRDINILWDVSWEGLRNDLRPRYPKHYWPDLPRESRPVRMKKDV